MAALKTGTKIGLVAALTAAATAWYWFYLTRQVALPEDRSGFVVAFFVCVSLGLLAFIKRTSWLGALPPVFAIAVGVFLPTTMMISEQVVARDVAIEVGDTIPRFTAVDDTGATFDSRSLNGHLVLIKFFRAHW